jgi:hypothetical protein
MMEEEEYPFSPDDQVPEIDESRPATDSSKSNQSKPVIDLNQYYADTLKASSSSKPLSDSNIDPTSSSVTPQSGPTIHKSTQNNILVSQKQVHSFQLLQIVSLNS